MKFQTPKPILAFIIIVDILFILWIIDGIFLD
jgi:hypothetical protein